MSRYEWEKGEFVIPAAEWASLKTAIRNVVNRRNATMLETATQLHAMVAIAAKGRKNHEFRDIAFAQADKLNQGGHYGPRFTSDETWQLVCAVIGEKYDDKTRKVTYRIKKPLKKDFPQHGNNVTVLIGDECSVSFDNAKRVVHWTVHENNHACERARETVLGQAFFQALKKVNWTRGSGGSIYGNDEYNQDSGRNCPGGGGSYTKEQHGPGLGKPLPKTVSGYGSTFRF